VRFCLLIVLCAGCSTFRSEQTETDAAGITHKTSVTLRSFFDSHSDLSKLRTTLTDKSQGISIGSISQDSSGTNVSALIQNVVAAAVEAAIKSTVKP